MSANLTLVRRAIILAAGNGDRFRSEPPRSKLLATVAGTPLLVRTLTSASEAGITDAHLVLGYDAVSVRAAACAGAPPNLNLSFHLNENWREENGLSLLTARPYLNGSSFALLMGDHIFEASVLKRLFDVPRAPGEALLAVDSGPTLPEIAREATKVRMEGDRVTSIGKDLDRYDALDTGLFVCDPSVFDATEASCAAGDTTLSGGIRRLAARGLIRGIDIGDANWCDVDTIDDLAVAQQLVSGRRA
jgi:choline kinase